LGLSASLPIAMATLVTAAGLHLQQSGYSASFIIANSLLGCCLTLLCSLLVLPLHDLAHQTAKQLQL
jgi:hypothetical protein